MKLTSVGTVIAQRELSVPTKATVSVVIGKPEPYPDGNGYYCPYQILGLGEQKIRSAGGQDTVQALILALRAIGVVLYTSREAKEGLLTWNGNADLGFPVPDSIRDLAP